MHAVQELGGGDGGQGQASVAVPLEETEAKGLGASGDVLYVGTIQGRVYALRIPAADSN